MPKINQANSNQQDFSEHQENVFFKSLIEQLQDCVLIKKNGQDFFSYISPAWERIAGNKATQHENIEQLFKPIILPEDWSVFERLYSNLKQNSGLTEELELRFISKPDKNSWVRCKIFPYFDTKNNPAGYHFLLSDITLEKELQLQLQQKEEFERKTKDNLISFFNTVGDFLFVLDMQGNIVTTNETVLTRLGYTAEELKGQSVLIVHPEERRQEAWQTVTDMLMGKMEFCPIPLRTKSGELIPVETRVNKGIWNNQEMLFGLSKDISLLRFSEEKFNKVFENSPIPFAIQDFNTHKIIDVNQAFVNFTGYRKEEVLNKTSAEINLFPDPDGPAAAIKKLLLNGSFSNFESQIKTKNGEIKTGIFNGTIILVQHQKYIITMMMDITEKKQIEQELQKSEQRWQFALEGAGDGVWDWNLNTGEVFFSRQWKKMLGYEEHEITNHLSEWEKRVHPADLQKCYDDIQDYLQGKTEIYKNVHRMYCKNGDYKWILDRGKKIGVNSEGKPTRMIGTHTDLTTQKNTEKMLLELVEIKNKLFTIVGHDLRNPIGNILNFSDIALKSLKNNDYKSLEEALGYIHLLSDQSLDLLGNLINWASSQASDMRFNKQLIKIEDLMTRILPMLQNTARNKNIALETDLQGPAVFTADLNMLETILRNLISNALKFTPQNGKIFIQFTQTGPFIQFCVADTGIGMKPETLDSLFQYDKKIKSGTAGERGL